MAESALKFVLNSAFFLGSTPYHFKNGKIVSNFTFYLLRKILFSVFTTIGVYFYYNYAMRWRLSAGASPFTLKLTGSLRLSWIVQEILEAIFIVKQNKKFLKFMNDLVIQIRSNNIEISDQKVKFIVILNIIYHSLLVPYSVFYAFPQILVLQLNQFMYAVAVLHFSISCLMISIILILLIELLNKFETNFLTNRTKRVIKEFYLIYEIPRNFLGVVGEFIVVKVFLTILIFTLGSYMQVYVYFFLKTSVVNNYKSGSVRGVVFYLLANVFMVYSLVVVNQFDKVAQLVSF